MNTHRSVTSDMRRLSRTFTCLLNISMYYYGCYKYDTFWDIDPGKFLNFG